MTEIITYRLSATGAWGYEFYDAGRNRIGSVSTDVMPSSPALIKGEGILQHGAYDCSGDGAMGEE